MRLLTKVALGYLALMAFILISYFALWAIPVQYRSTAISDGLLSLADAMPSFTERLYFTTLAYDYTPTYPRAVEMWAVTRFSLSDTQDINDIKTIRILNEDKKQSYYFNQVLKSYYDASFSIQERLRQVRLALLLEQPKNVQVSLLWIRLELLSQLYLQNPKLKTISIQKTRETLQALKKFKERQPEKFQPFLELWTTEWVLMSEDHKPLKQQIQFVRSVLEKKYWPVVTYDDHLMHTSVQPFLASLLLSKLCHKAKDDICYKHATQRHTVETKHLKTVSPEGWERFEKHRMSYSSFFQKSVEGKKYTSG